MADSVYDLFAPVAEDLGYDKDPRLEPSPFFTTLHGERTRFDASRCLRYGSNYTHLQKDLLLMAEQ